MRDTKRADIAARAAATLRRTERRTVTVRCVECGDPFCAWSDHEDKRCPGCQEADREGLRAEHAAAFAQGEPIPDPDETEPAPIETDLEVWEQATGRGPR